LTTVRFGSSGERESEMTAMKSAGMYVTVSLPVYFGIVAYTYDTLYWGDVHFQLGILLFRVLDETCYRPTGIFLLHSNFEEFRLKF
jgi:hypothetical protein